MNNRKFFIVGVGAIGLILIVVCTVMLRKGSIDPTIPPPESHSSRPLQGGVPEYDYTEAANHIGERAVVKGTIARVFTSKSGVTFLDFCSYSSSCPFSAVIFASDAAAFSDVSQYQRAVKLTGVITAYQGNAEMVLSSPEQIE